MTGIESATDEERSRAHAQAAVYMASLGPDHHADVLHHARAAGPDLATQELVELLDRTGELSLSIGAYHDAAELLAYADSVDQQGDYRVQVTRLCALAAAVDGMGRVDEARQHLARAVSLGTLANDHAMVARAAVLHALPVDWYAGDDRAAGFLRRAEGLRLDPVDAVAVMAARALVEMRIPLWETNGEQVAWITRPGVAQPLAHRALVQSADLDEPTRLLALLAWRGTHRGPDHLARRREVSREAFDLAQRLHHPSFQVDAGVWLAVDAAELGDRPTYDHTVALVHALAERDGNPRLRWRALTLVAGQALLNIDFETAEGARRRCAELVTKAHLPGWGASDLFMAGQMIVTRDDPDGLAMMTAISGEPVMQNPIAIAGVAYAHARVGDPLAARQLCHRALTRLDGESSLLLVATRLAATAVLLDDAPLRKRLIHLLTPYRDHGSVDSNGWWYDGPVDAWLALLHHANGNAGAAHSHTQRAFSVATAFRDQRTLERLAPLVGCGDHDHSQRPLTGREIEVLRLVAQGCTNAEIAEALNFSVSTIRQTLSSLYDRAGVRTRASVVAYARAGGLLDTSKGACGSDTS